MSRDRDPALGPDPALAAADLLSRRASAVRVRDDLLDAAKAANACMGKLLDVEARVSFGGDGRDLLSGTRLQESLNACQALLGRLHECVGAVQARENSPK